LDVAQRLVFDRRFDHASACRRSGVGGDLRQRFVDSFRFVRSCLEPSLKLLARRLPNALALFIALDFAEGFSVSKYRTAGDLDYRNLSRRVRQDT
jgi:hypothetical protein